MKKILAITLASAAASAIVYYLYDRDGLKENLEKLKQYAGDIVDKVKNKSQDKAEDVAKNMVM